MPCHLGYTKGKEIKIKFCDIGAAGGLSSSIDKTAIFACDIEAFAFEPNPEEFSKLDSAEYKRKFCLGVSGNGGNRKLYLTRDPYVSSLLEPNLEAIPENQKSRYQTIQIDNVKTVAANEISDIAETSFNWIKIDTQGLEGEIIKAFTDLEETTLIIAELSQIDQYKKQILMSEIVDHLAKVDFHPMKITYKINMKCEHDVYFVRSTSLLDNESVKYSAGVAHLIFGDNIKFGLLLIKNSVGISGALKVLLKIKIYNFLQFPKRVARDIFSVMRYLKNNS